jgi:hypothetical protein
LLIKTKTKKKSTFAAPTFTKVRFSSLNFKTGQITSSTFQTVHFTSVEQFRRRFYYSDGGFATMMVILFFPF